MEYFCVTRKEERERENRGKKALHVTPKGMAERSQSKQVAPEARESLFAEQARSVPLGTPDMLLRSVHLRGNETQPAKQRQQRLWPG
jgi:hypothetical protein